MKFCTLNILAFLTLFLSVSVRSSGQNSNFNGELVFSTTMTGSQEVPQVATPAKGVAGLKLSRNWDSLWIQASFDNLTSGITGAHIHLGAAGTTGSVLIDLDPYRVGNNISGVVTGASLTPALISSMVSGGTYINIHTSNNTSG